MGKKEKDLKDIKIYIKPEESKAYYVINGVFLDQSGFNKYQIMESSGDKFI